MPGTHAFLSPSAAHRWLHCTAAPELEARMPESTSVYAEEGTLAHAICEAKLRAYLSGDNAELIYQKNDGGGERFWTDEELYQPEMEEYTDTYRDVVLSLLEQAKETTPDAKLLVEQRVEITSELFGTTDAMIVADGVMNVIDYKHGKGVKVSATDNPQMMIYALAAYLEYSDEYNIHQVDMTIVQPRINNISRWSITVEGLQEWYQKKLIPAIQSALGKAPKRHEAGGWCRFCKVKHQCRTLAGMAEGTPENNDNPQLLSLAEIAALLPKVDAIKAWCEDITSFALKEALDGKILPGYKVVEGRSKRVITDPDKLAAEMTTNGLDPVTFYKTPELRSLTDLEKMIGKKAFNEKYGTFIVKQPGKPTLATDDDKRPEYQANQIESDFGDIKELL